MKILYLFVLLWQEVLNVWWLLCQIVECFGVQYLQVEVILCDLYVSGIVYIDFVYVDVLGFFVVLEGSDVGQGMLVFLDCFIEELEQVDQVVIGMFMYNYIVFLVLKVWIDYVVWVCWIFVIILDGKVGLLCDWLVYVVVVFGGCYIGVLVWQLDFFMFYLKVVLVIIGLYDLCFIVMEGLVVGVQVVCNECECVVVELDCQFLRG